MILLDDNNKIIEDALGRNFASVKNNSIVRLDQLVFCDFDGTHYELLSSSDKTVTTVSIFLKYFKELEKHGASELLRRVYGKYLQDKPQEGFSVTLKYELHSLPDDVAPIIYEASLLKRNCFASVFERYFDQREGLQRAVIHYREDETIYIESKPDRVTVIFSTLFKDPDDIVIGQIFLQELREGRKAAHTAPAILFSLGEPPAELRDQPEARVGPEVGYITFVLFDRHTNAKSRGKTISLLHIFRDYLHYHIKCTKSFHHSRMRTKVFDALKVLSRAEMETGREKEKKTFDGRTFIQSVKDDPTHSTRQHVY